MADNKITFILSAIDRGASKTANAVHHSLGKLDGAARRAGGAVKSLGANLLKLGAVGLAGIAAALTGAVKAAMEFETAMLNVNSIVKAGPADLESMRQSVIGLSKELPQSAETLAKGLYDIASSGFAGKQGIEVLEAAARAASAGLATTEQSAAGLTAVLNAYNLKAKSATKISDIMFKTVDRGVITFPELAENIGKTTAVSARLKIRFEEVAAALALMTRKGIGAEEATTQINAIMISILKPAKEAEKLAKKLGLEWDTNALAAKGLSGVLADMTEKTKGNSKQMATLLGDSRAIRGAFILAAGGGKQFRDEIAAMDEAAGATNTALGIQKEGLAFQMGILGNNIQAVAIQLGSVLIPMITPLVKGLSTWLAENDKLIASVGMFISDTLTKAGTFISTVLIPAVQSLIKTFTDAGASVARVVGPIVRDLLPGFQRVQVAIFGGGKASGGGGLGKAAGGLVGAVVRLIGVLWGDGKGALANVLRAVGHVFKHVIIPAIELTIGAITRLINFIIDAIHWLEKLNLYQQRTHQDHVRYRTGGGLASGGVRPAGWTGWVGERGPELAMALPGGGIAVRPNQGGGGGGMGVAINITYAPAFSGPGEEQRFATAVVPAITREMRRQRLI